MTVSTPHGLKSLPREPPQSLFAGMNLVQTIDFSPFLRGEDDARKAVAGEILRSFKTIGFISLTNHGVPQDKVDAMFDWSKKFFALPMEQKMLAPHPANGAHHRGYSSPGREVVTRDEFDEAKLKELREVNKDYKESFESGRENDPILPNIWLPEDVLPGFREACLDFYWTCYELEKNVLRALATALNLDEEYFIPFHSDADSQLRLLHYPSVTRQSGEDLSRIAAHTDFDTITLLFQDNVGGLEVEDPNQPGTFIAVTPVANSVVVNAGDFLARWSNDIIKSTLHRVRAPPGAAVGGAVRARYSIPYFCACNLNMVVDAIPGTWNEENPKKYEPTSVMEYIMKRLASAY